MPLDKARLKYFGGSTNHWAGWCRPFEPIDFDREYMGEEYVWPIKYSDLLKYRSKACYILDIPNEYEINDIELNNDIRKIDFQFSTPVRFASKYKEILARDKNIDIYLNSNLVDILGTKKNINLSNFSSLSGKSISIKAKKFIFAMGGIENSRYLLWFQKKYGNKFFNTNIPIGKYWMEHPHFTIGRVLVNKNKLKDIFYATSYETQRRLKILGCGLRVEPLAIKGTKKLINELLCIAPSFSKSFLKSNLVCGANFRAAWEQSPNIYNKIVLSNDHDIFGINKVNLIWKKNHIDRNTLLGTINCFNNLLIKKNIGRIQLKDWVLNNKSYPLNDELAGCHHMGGTRMHNSLKFGVVDSNCKVYGSNNLYIIGSSVFTTGGFNNPTLPIVQFALRLADHLAK